MSRVMPTLNKFVIDFSLFKLLDEIVMALLIYDLTIIVCYRFITDKREGYYSLSMGLFNSKCPDQEGSVW